MKSSQNHKTLWSGLLNSEKILASVLIHLTLICTPSRGKIERGGELIFFGFETLLIPMPGNDKGLGLSILWYALHHCSSQTWQLSFLDQLISSLTYIPPKKVTYFTSQSVGCRKIFQGEERLSPREFRTSTGPERIMWKV